MKAPTCHSKQPALKFEALLEALYKKNMPCTDVKIMIRGSTSLFVCKTDTQLAPVNAIVAAVSVSQIYTTELVS